MGLAVWESIYLAEDREAAITSCRVNETEVPTSLWGVAERPGASREVARVYNLRIWGANTLQRIIFGTENI